MNDYTTSFNQSTENDLRAEGSFTVRDANYGDGIEDCKREWNVFLNKIRKSRILFGTVKLLGEKLVVPHLDKRKQTTFSNAVKAVIENTSEAKAKARVFAPVDTGKLKEKIADKYEPSKVPVVTDFEISKYVKGTIESPVRNEQGFPYGVAQEYGPRPSNTKPFRYTPHIRPAIEAQKNKFINDIKKAVE